ncbi:DUF3304 domain-containing protein [Massilia sp.]|uniref:DUF3304 domain-containing protein n=1 Tax=Massilia sp. TaxID=1882437 RepID=UPI00289D9D62|nr:DUF3304 domain-containing protein [Massilia sp.]
MKKRKIIYLRVAMSLVFVLATTACTDSTNAVSVRGYNHMKVLAIRGFTVNGVMGPNVDTESGGGETCCISIPKQWRPGLKAKVSWSYDQNDDVQSPLPAGQSTEVDIPEYRFVGALHVHFYDEHKIKIIVSRCSPRHPFYPMRTADLAPWQPSETKKDAREAARRVGDSIDC